ncbi:hypothetical protein FRB95_009987 [Tulasnella sp. JGI-2019a]|nr:hypothetical protein FRB95_009987 [Tulasnella sp. JGI-2019a]
MGHAETFRSSKYVPPTSSNWDTKNDDIKPPSNDDGPNTSLNTNTGKHTDDQELQVRIRDDSHLISHDPRLSEDGDALYRFLLEQAAIPPSYRVTCLGMHAETRTRRVQRNNGNIETQTYQEWVLDFAFAINLTLSIIPEPLGVPIYLVGDRTPAYRGKTVIEVDEGPHKTADGKDLEMNQIGTGKELRRKV